MAAKPVPYRRAYDRPPRCGANRFEGLRADRIWPKRTASRSLGLQSLWIANTLRRECRGQGKPLADDGAHRSPRNGRHLPEGPAGDRTQGDEPVNQRAIRADDLALLRRFDAEAERVGTNQAAAEKGSCQRMRKAPEITFRTATVYQNMWCDRRDDLAAARRIGNEELAVVDPNSSQAAGTNFELPVTPTAAIRPATPGAIRCRCTSQYGRICRRNRRCSSGGRACHMRYVCEPRASSTPRQL